VSHVLRELSKTYSSSLRFTIVSALRRVIRRSLKSRFLLIVHPTGPAWSPSSKTST
jgi:hypothetical protein